MKTIKTVILIISSLLFVCIFNSCTKSSIEYYRELVVSEDEHSVQFVIIEISSKEISDLKLNNSVLDANHIYYSQVITSGKNILIKGDLVFYKITILKSKFLKGKQYKDIQINNLIE